MEDRVVRWGLHDTYNDTFECLDCAGGLTHEEAVQVGEETDYCLIDDTLLSIDPLVFEHGLWCDKCGRMILEPVKEKEW